MMLSAVLILGLYFNLILIFYRRIAFFFFVHSGFLQLDVMLSSYKITIFICWYATGVLVYSFKHAIKSVGAI